MPLTTVLGEIDDDAVGLTLPHEHLIASCVAEWDAPEDPAELTETLRPFSIELLGRSTLDPTRYRNVLLLNDPAATAEELRPFVEAGGRTVVDLSPPGLGRDPVALRAIARLTGLNVVMGCGEYREMAHGGYVRGATVEQIADVMVADLTDGVGRTGIRAGVIGEIGSGNPVTDDEGKVLRAAARAQMAVGVALNIHRTPFPDPMAGMGALDIVLREGVDPSRVIMSHCDERPEPEFALEVGRRGAFVELDTFGMERWASNWSHGGHAVRRSVDRDRVDILKACLDGGLEDRLLLSHDVCMQPQLIRGGGWGYGHLSTNIEPVLEQAGIDRRQIDAMRIDNPRRALCHPAPAVSP